MPSMTFYQEFKHRGREYLVIIRRYHMGRISNIHIFRVWHNLQKFISRFAIDNLTKLTVHQQHWQG